MKITVQEKIAELESRISKLEEKDRRSVVTEKDDSRFWDTVDRMFGKVFTWKSTKK